MLDSGVAFAGAWVSQGTYIAQIVAVACVHIWAPSQVLGIRAQLRGTGLCPPHSFSLFAFGVVGGQKHTSDQRDADTFPLGWQNCIYQQNGETGFTPFVSKCNSKRTACTVRSYIRSTAIDFVDRLKCHGMCAKLNWGCIEYHASLNQSMRCSNMKYTL